MSSVSHSTAVLVILRRPEDVQLAQALHLAVGPELEFFLLFGEEELLDRYGESEHRHGFDAHACILNPMAFSLLISFSGPAAASDARDLLLINYFNEVGLPTIEIQSHPFQEGFSPLNEQQQVGDKLPDSRRLAPLRTSYAARTVIGWAGEQGIGYVKSDLVGTHSEPVRDDLILITSGFDWDGYSDKERYQFAISVLKLAQHQPELSFVWRPRPEELTHVDGKVVLSMVEDHALPNLRLETRESIESIMPRCRAGIAMPSVSVYDFAICGKPVATYSSAMTDAMLRLEKGRGFRNYFELLALWPQLWAQPQRFRLETNLPNLNHARLRERLVQAHEASALRSDWQPIAMKYAAYMRDEQARHVQILHASASFSQVGRRIAALEKTVVGVERAMTKVPARLTKILDRVGVLQRSTLAYKALKFVSGRSKLKSSDDS